jgi:hypothetical protein
MSHRPTGLLTIISTLARPCLIFAGKACLYYREIGELHVMLCLCYLCITESLASIMKYSMYHRHPKSFLLTFCYSQTVIITVLLPFTAKSCYNRKYQDFKGNLQYGFQVQIYCNGTVPFKKCKQLFEYQQ